MQTIDSRSFPLYRVLTNSSIPISEKLALLNEFKGHVKKELVHAASINSYFEALCYGLENYQDTKIDHLCHSSLCYLIKRVAMQAPESYQSSTIDSLIKALLLAYPRDKKLWSGSVKALEAIYLATPQQFETSLESLCQDPTYRTHSLLFIEELIQLNQRNNRNPMEVLNRFIPIFLKILNDQKTVKQDLELIYDIVSKYYNESAMEEFIKNLRHNEEAVQIFKKSVRTTVDVERPTAIFDVSAELKNILQDKASAPLDSKDYLSFNDAAHAIEQLLPPFQSSKETEHNWRNRQESIIKLRSIVRGNITSSYPKEFVTLCKDLQLIDCISKAALSLRTTLSAHGCQVVKDMTVHLKENLDPLVEQLFVPLRNLLSSTKKIASNNAHTTICTLLSYVSFSHKIFQQCLMLSRDKNVSPRSSSATFLRIYIIRFHQRLESSLVYIDEWLQKGVTDAQNTVRASMRLTFWYYYKTYPSNAKRLLDYLSPQFKRAVEMAKPDHLEINYTVKNNSSRRSSLNAKRLPSYAAPTQASHIQKFAPATRSISEFQDHPAGNVSPNLAQQTAQRRTSAPYSLIRRSINAKKENTVSEVMATTTLDFPTSPHVGLNAQLDLTDEFTNSHSNTLIKKYMETNHEENRVRQSQGELKNMYLHLSSTDLSQKLQGLHFLQNLLVVETPIDSAALLPLLSPVMIKCPNNFKPLLKLPRFHELIPLETLIELFAINQIDIPTLSSGHQTEKIIASTVAVIKRIFPTDPQLSIYYVKYRQIIFNYCFDVISEMLSTGFDLTASLFESCATELIGVCGNDFDTIKYYGLILTLFTSDKEHFVSILRKAPLSIALKIGQELEKNDSDFHIRSVLSREPSQDADVPMDDDRKYMDMTMVNPWNSKQQRASSNGSVIHNQFFEEGEEKEEEGEEEKEEEVEVNEEEGEEGEELEPGFTKFGGFSKLTEMTKVVSVYQREDLESVRVQGQKEKGSDLKFENNEHNTDNQSESTVDIKMEGVEDFKGDVDLSDIFMGDHRSHTGEHTVKFNEVPKIIDQRTLSTLPFNVAKKLIRDPANDSSASSSATADDENVSALIKGERDKSPTVPFPEHESKELSSKINGIQLRKKELDDLPVVGGVNKIFGVDHISSGIDVLSKVSPGWLLEYELTLIMQTTDVSDFLAKLKKTVSVVKDGPFTIKDLNFIIAVFLLCGNSSEFINWLVDQNGFAEICFINKLLLKSTDDNVQIPANIAYKSLILSTCLIIADSQLDRKFLTNQDLEEFWYYLITLLGNLCGYSNELFIACSEFRDVLIDCIPSYFKNLFENCIKLLSGNEQSPVKITFTLNTISRLLDYIGSTLSLDVLKALTGFIHRLAAEDLTEWREESTRILAKIYDILIARHTPPLYIEQTMEQLSTSQFDMVKAISSYASYNTIQDTCNYRLGMMTTKSELVSKFGPDSDKAETLTSLETLMKIYALSAEDLYIRWEQFSYHKNENKTELNDRNIEQFKHFMQQQIEKKLNNATGSVSSNPSSTKKPKTLRPNGSSPSLFGFGVPKTPTLKKRKLDNTPSRWDANSGSSLKVEFIGSKTGSPGEAVHFKTPSALNANSTPMMAPVTPSPLKNNPEPGKVLDSLNPESLEISEGIDFESEKKIRVTPFYDPKKYKFRTMRQSLLDASDVLDEQIDILTQIVQDHYKLSANDFGDPTIQSQSEIITVGRIVSDSPTSEGILNIDSLALETSRSAGIGRRVRLNLEKIKEASFFPGQLVSFRGKNANGEYFMVEEILQLPYLNSPVSTSTELHDYQQVLNHKSMKVVVTSGPYTATNNFDFSNLSAFVERLNTEIKPHSVIMFGPFIDITHPMVASGTLPEFPNLKIQPRTLDEVFTKVMAPILKNIDSRIQVILIPSTKDALSKHAAYPQDSLDRKLLQLPKNFKCFTNPSTFQLNEIFFACSNVDIFKDLKEVTKGGNTTLRNRFDRVSEHVLQQRRFYPVFPGGIKKRKVKNSEGHDVFEHISGADLEVPYLGLTEFVGNFIPDIIIIPSELYHFARVVQNVVMINPGMFVRPNGGRGTFAQFSIESPDLTNGKLTKIDGDDDVYLHNVWKRSRIDIVTS